MTRWRMDQTMGKRIAQQQITSKKCSDTDSSSHPFKLTSSKTHPFHELRPRGPPKALRGGISKVNFQWTLSIFGDKCPQNGSKNEQRAPRTSMGCPHIGVCVGRSRHLAADGPVPTRAPGAAWASLSED